MSGRGMGRRPARDGASAGQTMRAIRRFPGACLAGALILAAAAVMSPQPAPAQSARNLDDDSTTVRHVVVTLNKSRTFHVAAPFTSAVVGAPDLADVLPLTDHSLYVLGKKIGTTNVMIYDAAKHVVGVLDIEVALDAASLQEKIRESTGNHFIHVTSTNGQIVLSGVATDAVTADRAVAVAKALSPNGVVNAMSVAPSQQVLLKVRFLEASRNAGRQLGVNWSTSGEHQNVNIGQGSVVQSPAGTVLPLVQAAGTLAGTSTAPFGVVLADIVNKGTSIDVLVSALETQGLVRRLAEPNLMALSGDTAQFLAGGEFPVPIAATSANGIVTPTIEFKPFGVRLSFTPTVLGQGLINLKIAPEVSELDFTNAVSISGTTIPALVKRDAVTTVELRDGQSFAIAGLLQADDLRNRSQIPWLGSVPVLGALFSSSSYQKNETDLVIIVTPHLVQPAAPGQQLATPFDRRLPSNDVDFFLLGESEVKKRAFDYVNSGGEVHGPYGHIIPSETSR
ncbi:MAG TPA: type II and III secretion system protein family protein [Xanthobacteraceae bacterium]